MLLNLRTVLQKVDFFLYILCSNLLLPTTYTLNVYINEHSTQIHGSYNGCKALLTYLDRSMGRATVMGLACQHITDLEMVFSTTTVRHPPKPCLSFRAL